MRAVELGLVLFELEKDFSVAFWQRQETRRNHECLPDRILLFLAAIGGISWRAIGAASRLTRPVITA